MGSVPAPIPVDPYEQALTLALAVRAAGRTPG